MSGFKLYVPFIRIKNIPETPPDILILHYGVMEDRVLVKWKITNVPNNFVKYLVEMNLEYIPEPDDILLNVDITEVPPLNIIEYRNIHKNLPTCISEEFVYRFLNKAFKDFKKTPYSFYLR